MSSFARRFVTLVVVGWGTSLLAADAPVVRESDREKDPVVMDSVKIEGNYVPRLSFGLSLDLWRDNNSRKTTAIYVSNVRPGSPAEKNGVRPRSRIYRIDGRPVDEYAPSFFQGTELNRIFVHRRGGARVTLEIIDVGDVNSRIVTLEEKVGTSLPGMLDRYGN